MTEAQPGEVHIIKMRLGTVEMPRPTGRCKRGKDGLWREVYTDKVVRDHFGREVSREPFVSPVGYEAVVLGR